LVKDGETIVWRFMFARGGSARIVRRSIEPVGTEMFARAKTLSLPA